MSNRGRVRTEQGLKRVRAYLNGVLVADTNNVLLVWEKPYYPAFYIPAADVNTELLVATGETTRSPSRGSADLHTVKVDGAEAVDAAAWYTDSPIPEIADHIHISWDAMMAENGGHRHCMLKEIHEQVNTVADCMRGRLNVEEGWVNLGGMKEHTEQILKAKRIIIAACGTSVYAPTLQINIRQSGLHARKYHKRQL